MTVKEAIVWVRNTYSENVVSGMDAKSVRIEACDAEWITLKMPGERDGKRVFGDYCAETEVQFEDGSVGFAEISHLDICNFINNYLIEGIMTYDQCIIMLEDLFHKGLFYRGEDSDITVLRSLIFWVSLQEEINYPANYQKGGTRLGRKHPFLRYAEAAILTLKGEYTSKKMSKRVYTKRPIDLEPIRIPEGARQPDYYNW